MIANRRELEQAVLQLMEATQDTDYQARVGSWVDLGLQDVFSRARCGFAIRAAVATVQEDGTILMPPSYLQMLTVVGISFPGAIPPVTPDQASLLFNSTGPVRAYLIEGNLLTLLPPQTAPLTARYTYYSMLEPLIDPEDSNAYLKRAGSACLYASAGHGEVYRGNPEQAAAHFSLAAERIDALNAETAGYGYGPGVQVHRVR